MRIVTDEFEIFELEVVNVFDGRVQFHLGQRSVIARKLLARLLEMIVVEMQVAKCMDEIARHEINNLGHHHREQRVACDVERNAEKKIAAALVKLATQLAVLDIQLEEDVTRWQGHLVDLGRIPCAHYQPPALRIRFDLCDQIIDLVHSRAVCPAPIAPLCAINTTELAVFIGPFIPDRHAVLVEITSVGVAAQEPEQLINDGFDVQLFCGEQREPRPVLAQIKPRLRAENG